MSKKTLIIIVVVFVVIIIGMLIGSFFISRGPDGESGEGRLRDFFPFGRSGEEGEGMKTLILQRVTNYWDVKGQGIMGVLIKGSSYVPFCNTLELPWSNNTQFISCIPSGLYVCERITSPTKGETFEITNVFNRSNILFHKGNIDDDTQGCILLGEGFGYISDEPAITRSRDAFNEFMEMMKDISEFRLDLRSVVVNPLSP